MDALRPEQRQELASESKEDMVFSKQRGGSYVELNGDQGDDNEGWTGTKMGVEATTNERTSSNDMTCNGYNLIHNNTS